MKLERNWWLYRGREPTNLGNLAVPRFPASPKIEKSLNFNFFVFYFDQFFYNPSKNPETTRLPQADLESLTGFQAA